MDFVFGASKNETIGSKKLQVRIGASVDSLKVAKVNDSSDPHFIDSPYFTGNILVRIKNFDGIIPEGEKYVGNEQYFENKKRMFALQVCGRFKHEYIVEDILFGAEFEKKVSPPTGIWIACKFATMIDPALKIDIYSHTPWFYSPLLCSMNTIAVYKAINSIKNAAPFAKQSTIDQPTKQKLGNEQQLEINGPDIDYKPNPSEYTSVSLSKLDNKSLRDILPEWDRDELKEDNVLLLNDISGLKVDASPYKSDESGERRKYFQKAKVRKNCKLIPDKIYAPFIDLNTFDLSLGINVNILQYLNQQPIRMMTKSQSTGKIFFVVEFDLVNESQSNS